MNKFEMGDRIKCIDTAFTKGRLKFGKIYKIKGFRYKKTFIILDRNRDRGFAWSENRFILYTSYSLKRKLLL